jgi:hypothetical protein
MQDLTDITRKMDNENHERHLKVDDEYSRLVMPGQHGPLDNTSDTKFQPQLTKSRPFAWWIKFLFACMFSTILGYVFIKWGVPFLFEKVRNISFFFFWYQVQVNRKTK